MFSPRHHGSLPHRARGHMRNEALPQFSRGELYRALCGAVSDHFTAASRRNTLGAYSKALLMIALAAGCYVAYLTIPLGTLGLILLSVLFGIVLGGIAFNIQHDANHGAFEIGRAHV